MKSILKRGRVASKLMLAEKYFCLTEEKENLEKVVGYWICKISKAIHNTKVIIDVKATLLSTII